MPKSSNRLFSVTEFFVKLGILLVCVLMALISVIVVAVVVSDGTATVELKPNYYVNLGGRKSIAGFITLLLILAPMLPALFKLRAVVRSARVGDPFTRANGSRLRAIAWLLLASYLVQWGFVLAGFTEGWMAALITPWKGIAPVLLFFVVAQIFDHGAEMRAELEGTV